MTAPSSTAEAPAPGFGDEPRLLTKSHFLLALECPTKLSYVGDAAYADAREGDPFLEALADGGFQVGALARLMFPGGTEVASAGNAEQVRATETLLQAENAVVYEAAFRAGRLFARVDILIKRGRRIELIEVKAKSVDTSVGDPLRTPKGRIRAAMLPYLCDIAFQRHVVAQARPDFAIECSLLMVDTARVCTVDGLNQRFRVMRTDGAVKVVVADGTDAAALGDPILARIEADSAVDEMLRTPLAYPGGAATLADLAETWSDAHARNRRIDPVIGSHCGTCEFRVDDGSTELLSGFHRCWREALHWRDADLRAGTVLDVWNLRNKGPLIHAGVHRLSDLKRSDLTFAHKVPGLCAGDRQWFQASGRWPGGGPFYLRRDLLARAFAAWTFPLHFVDFETAAVALPFNAGRRPYETIAFQFSLHLLEEDGSVVHRDDFLEATPGVFPNYRFARALVHAIGPRGTVLIWSKAEVSTLKAIQHQLETDPVAPADAAELGAFIRSLTAGQGRAARPTARHRAARIVDLRALAQQTFFHPATGGGLSIKDVLPAVLGSSALLRARYATAEYGTPAMPSRNFRATRWYVEEDGRAVDPYALLPGVFAHVPDVERNAMSTRDAAMRVANGGAATTAYARLQFEQIDDQGIRAAIEKALLRYCELDTLAMVMIYQAWHGWVEEMPRR